jgi:hypothetical protein
MVAGHLFSFATTHEHLNTSNSILSFWVAAIQARNPDGFRR